jgi:elongation factor P
MIKAGSIDKGMTILMKNDPYLVAEREFVNPGKGSAFVRLKLKNLKTGQVLKEVLKSQESVEEVDVVSQKSQYMYTDGEGYHFMDNETFDQYAVPIEGFEDIGLFIQEGGSYEVMFFEEAPIDIKIPYKVVFTVTEAEEAIKGDTVTGATKTVKVETGLEVKVPIFIKQGEKILVNTETREYVERVNN